MQKSNVMVSPDVIVKLSNLTAAVSDHINYGHTFCWQSHDLAHDGAPMMDSYAFMICGLMVRQCWIQRLSFCNLALLLAYITVGHVGVGLIIFSVVFIPLPAHLEINIWTFLRWHCHLVVI